MVSGSDALHHVNKFAEQIVTVMRTCRCFRVILDSKGRVFFVPNAFDCIVVEIEVCDFHAIRKRIGIDCEAVIL